MTPEQAVATSENSHKPQNLREQFKKECEERKRKRHELQNTIYREASFTDKIKMTIRAWFDKSD
jgi:hypothetical protein